MPDSANQPKARRDRSGRFLKGASGNPAGRPPGLMNEATRTAAALLSAETGGLTMKAIDLAMAGDIAALRLCLDRIIAPQREQPIQFAMPAIAEPGDLQRAMAAVVRAAAMGGLTPAQAALFAQVLEAHARVIEVTARIEAERLAARHAEISARCDLRVCVVMAHELPEIAPGDLIEHEVREWCDEMRRIGRAARDTLATIPDTPTLVEADIAFIAAHPLPLDRSAHPIGAEMVETWQHLSAYLDRCATINQRAQIA